MSLEQFKTQVLLLHSEQRTLDLLSKAFSDRYSVHCATSGTEALNTLGDTPIHVIVCAQDLPGMSGLEALREAKKRSPDMIGILLAGTDSSDGLEALVGEQEVFQIIRGEVKPDDLNNLVESATKRVRLLTIAESANDTAANLDQPTGEHIVMETAANGSVIISDGTGTMPALKPERIQVSPNADGRRIDILVLSKDEEFLATIKESSLGLHDIYHANTPTQAEEIVRKHKVGVLVTDAAMVGSNIEVLTQRLRATSPRLVAIVAGRRDDGELLMDLINRGQVYRFLLKPVSPGRVRLAIEASVKHHMDAPNAAFLGKPRTAASPTMKPKATPVTKKPPPLKPVVKAVTPKPTLTVPPQKAQGESPSPEPMRAPVRETSALVSADLDTAFSDGGNFTETMTGIAVTVGKSIFGASGSIAGGAQSALESSGDATSGPSGIVKNPKFLAAAGLIAVVAIGATWMRSTSNDDASDANVVQTQPPISAPDSESTSGPTSIVDDVLGDSTELPEPAVLQGDFLQQARDALDAGDIVSPAGRNAMEFYVAARNAAPDNADIAAELSGLTEEVFSLAESDLLANRSIEAARALRVIGIADPDNPRLNFLNVQLEQQQFRNLLDQARAATDQSRFEDAARFLIQAQSIAGSNTTELDMLSEQLATARGEAFDPAAALAEANRIEAADAAAKRAAAERLAADEAAADQAEADRVAAEAAAAKQAEADRVAAEAAAAKQAEADRVAAEAAKQAEADRVAAAAAAAKQAEADRVAAEVAAAKQAEADRVAAEAAAAKQAEADRVAAEAAAAKQAEADRVAAEAAAAKQAEADRVAAEAAAAKQAEGDRVAAAAKQAEGDSVAAEAASKPASNSSDIGAAATANSGTPKTRSMVAITAVKRIHYVGPKYPRSAQRRNISGWVDLAFTVTTLGEVADIEVLQTDPSDIFNNAAITALEQWLFEPATENDQPIEKRIALRMSFNLQ